MLVKEFNEFIQLGFPKGFIIETEGGPYEENMYDNLGRLCLPDGIELSQSFVDNSWLEPEDGVQSLEECIPLEKAVNDYFSLDMFKVGDLVAVVSERGFIPNYWEGYSSYTSYKVDRKIHSIENRRITLSSVVDGAPHVHKYEQYSITGYKINPVFDEARNRRRRKLIGLNLNYQEYIVIQTLDVIRKRKEIDLSIGAAKRLYGVASELFAGASFCPSNTSKIEEAMELLEPLLNYRSREVLKDVLQTRDKGMGR